MWDVDPETKSKLLALQKINGNDRCCDCGAPSPQWASPKFSTFICLTCAGLHRSLGVHISFVRSITMDAFKPAEVSRLTLGGNAAWRSFWENHSDGGGGGHGGDNKAAANGNKTQRWADASIEERYSGSVGAEWKERLSAQVEGRAFVPAPVPPRVQAPIARTASPASSLPPSTNARNEAFFARKGHENATRPEDRPPSLGGRYAGFGSEGQQGGASSAATGQVGGEGGLLGVEELQREAVAAVGKGLGWLRGAVGMGVRGVGEGWVGKGVAKIAEADIANSARVAAAQVALTVQTGTKSAAEGLQRFVEGEGEGAGAKDGQVQLEPERRDFWDSFGGSGAGMGAGAGKSGAIGTAAVKGGAGGSGGVIAAGKGVGAGKKTGLGATKVSVAGAGIGAGKEDGWEEDGWERF